MSALYLTPELTDQERVLAKAMHDLMVQTPKNEFGFPLGLYRPDMLPLHDYQPEDEAAAKLLFLEHTPPQHNLAPLTPPSDSEGLLDDDEDGDDLLDGFDPFDEDDEDDLDDLGDDSDDLLENPFKEAQAQEEGSSSPRGGEGAGSRPGAREANETQAVQTVQSTQEARVAGFRKSDLRAAFVPLDYSEGYPTLDDGRPCWDRLSHEPTDAFTCFQAYLQMPKVADGIRTLQGLGKVMGANNLLELNGHQFDAFSAKFRAFSTIYCWNVRVKAYDLFKVAAYRKQQEQRAMSIQELHYEKSQKLLARLFTYMEDETEFWELMSPKVAEGLLKTLIGVQRVSVGLPASAPTAGRSSSDGAPSGAGQTMEMILRTLTQGANEEGGRVFDADGELATRILADPNSLKLAQELIIRISNSEQ